MLFFSPWILFFFLFKICFKKDKKCTDTLIRHKQIFCTNHISLDCLKKIAIQVLTIKSVRGYLFLEILLLRGLFWNIPGALGQAGRHVHCSHIPLAAWPRSEPSLSCLPCLSHWMLPFWKWDSAATAKIQPLQCVLSSSDTAWGGFSISPCWI